jgi:hypothetical protein
MTTAYLHRATVAGGNKGRNARSETGVTTLPKYTLQHKYSPFSTTFTRHTLPDTIPYQSIAAENGRLPWSASLEWLRCKRSADIFRCVPWQREAEIGPREVLILAENTKEHPNH